MPRKNLWDDDIREAAKCLEYASNHAPNPWLQLLQKKSVGKLKVPHADSPSYTSEQFKETCDELITMLDPSVRIMTVMAMTLMEYFLSRKAGLILKIAVQPESTTEMGKIVSWPDGRVIKEDVVFYPFSHYLTCALSFAEMPAAQLIASRKMAWLKNIELYCDTRNEPVARREEIMGKMNGHFDSVIAKDLVAGQKKRRDEALASLDSILAFIARERRTNAAVAEDMFFWLHQQSDPVRGLFPSCWLSNE